MNPRSLTSIACGILSMAVIHLAYWLNLNWAETLAAVYHCNPYIEGCVSTSRAVRSGPGLLVFKMVMLPVAALMGLTWYWVGAWMRRLSLELPTVRRWTVRLGIAGAVALVFYVLYLGTEGPVYSWLRRYGVIFFFGFTALAQLVAARFVWGVYHAVPRRAAQWFLGIVSAQWLIGVFSAIKGFFIYDPDMIDRLQNITEWLMIAAMSLGFVLIGLMLRGMKTTA